MATTPYCAATVDTSSVLKMHCGRWYLANAVQTPYNSMLYPPPRVPNIGMKGDTSPSQLNQLLRCVIAELETRARKEKTTLKYRRYHDYRSKNPWVIGVTRAFVVGHKWKTEDCWYQRHQDEDCVKHGCDFRHKFDDLQEIQKIKEFM